MVDTSTMIQQVRNLRKHNQLNSAYVQALEELIENLVMKIHELETENNQVIRRIERD